MEAWLLKVVGSINAFLADYLLLALLLGVGIWYTVKTKFVQVRCLGQGMKKVFGSVRLKGKKEKSGMSSFQAFATAVAAAEVPGAFTPGIIRHFPLCLRTREHLTDSENSA